MCVAKTKVFFYAFQTQMRVRKLALGLKQMRAYRGFGCVSRRTVFTEDAIEAGSLKVVDVVVLGEVTPDWSVRT
jgi:hypothetical protein